MASAAADAIIADAGLQALETEIREIKGRIAVYESKITNIDSSIAQNSTAKTAIQSNKTAEEALLKDALISNINSGGNAATINAHAGCIACREKIRGFAEEITSIDGHTTRIQTRKTKFQNDKAADEALLAAKNAEYEAALAALL